MSNCSGVAISNSVMTSTTNASIVQATFAYGTNLATAEMLILGLQRGDLDWREMIRRKRSVR